MALAGALDVRIERVVLGTAYRRDLLSEDESPNPASARRPIGPPAEQSPGERELNHARRQQLAWMDDQLRLRGFEPAFPHVKIKLDPTTDRGAYPT